MCKQCGAEKPQSAYYANDRTCKECRKAAVRANRLTKVEHYREYDKQRANKPDRVAARKAYALTPEGKLSRTKAKKRYIENNPKKRQVHIITGNAIRDGKLFKGPCEVCGSEDVVAHHCDYDQPLNIVWLCPQHHSDWHAENGEGLNAT